MGLSLKNKFSLFSAIIVGAVLLMQCEQNAEKTAEAEKKDTTACVTKKPLNPNGDSELALLMRSMYDSAASVKELIKQGKLPDKFPEAFLKIHTATPTDSTVRTVEFTAFANDYINGLNTLHSSPKEKLLSNYNMLVQKCVNCHQAVCPGPIQRINKLKLAEEAK